MDASSRAFITSLLILMAFYALIKLLGPTLILCGQSCLSVERRQPRSVTYKQDGEEAENRNRICCFCITNHREIFQIHLFMQQLAYITIHNGNLLSDFVYIGTVQAYSSGIYVAMLAFLIPSILVVLAFSIYGRKWKLFFLKLTGSIGMHMLVSDGCDTIDPIEKAQGVLGMIFILQTGP